MARYERKEITAELVLAWDHKGAFKGGHLVPWDVVRDGAELVSARQLAAEPIAGALQPGLFADDMLSTVQLDARGLDEATRDLATSREQLATTCEGAAGRPARRSWSRSGPRPRRRSALSRRRRRSWQRHAGAAHRRGRGCAAARGARSRDGGAAGRTRLTVP